MVKNKNIHFQLIENRANSNQLEILLHLYISIFSDAKPKFFRERLTTKENLLAIIALYDQKPIGLKIGYKYDNTTFYSWVGGVLENYREKGVAKRMAQLQENWVKQQGYIKVRTKSMNLFKPMMILNLKNGFDIKQVYTNDSGQTKIIFEKDI